MRRLGLLLCVMLPVLITTACREPLPSEDPAQVVQQFFVAIAAGDCPRVLSELGTPYRKKVAAAGCPELLHQLQRFPLERVVEVTPDGRSATARLVRSRLRGRHTEAIIRLQPEGGSWKIFAL